MSHWNRWIGVDFDQTLRKYNGDPIPRMVNRVKNWLNNGIEVRIITARVNPIDPPRQERYPGDIKGFPPGGCAEQAKFIEEWCIEHIGMALPIQWGKSSGMIEFWDDKAVRVEPDTGRRLSSCETETDSCEF